KERGRRDPAPQGVCLEAELRRYYDHAAGDDSALARAVGAGGRSESARGRAERARRDGCGRVPEVRMVQDVEELAADFKCVLLLNEELLGQVAIDIEVAGAAEDARSGDAEIALHRSV